MYSFESAISPSSFEDYHKKRKWEWEPKKDAEVVDLQLSKGSKLIKETIEETKVDVELHLETPLPAEGEQCLDLQSEQIHFYNVTTRKRNIQEPRQSSETLPSCSSTTLAPMSLELELNLPDGSSPAANTDTSKSGTWCTSMENSRQLGRNITRSLSWVCLAKDEQREMLATVCMRCHILVMLCKSSPRCPNCKFMHPPAPNPPLNLLNLISDDLDPHDRPIQPRTIISSQGFSEQIHKGK